VVTRQTSV